MDPSMPGPDSGGWSAVPRIMRRISLTQWILVGMVAGVLIGWLFPEASQQFKVVSNIFLRLIKCILVPLVFATLVVGIAGHSDDLKAVGRLALKAILYFEVVTTLALFFGLAAVNLARPGVGVALPVDPQAAGALTAKKVTFQGVIEHLVPQSFFEAGATNDVLQIVLFSVLFAVALTRVAPQPRQTMLRFFESLTEIMFKFTGLVMKFAPFGVGAAMAVTVGHSGVGVLLNLGKLILTLYAALAAFCVCVLLPVALLARLPVRRFVQAVREPALLAFSTTSSEAAMPDAMTRMVQMGVPRQIVSLVMPLGYSFNLDGSTLYLAIASVFVAQAAGVELSLAQQLLMMLTLMLTSKGMAGIPRASQVVLAGTLVSFNLPIEGVILIIGIDELLDMARTTVNLVGNCLATAVVARWEGEFRPPDDDRNLLSPAVSNGREPAPEAVDPLNPPP
ncbi:MAG: dicarboxylate/amino acid:cation symporter [Verrucomicrobia bacterium]|jgi:proton glutamate symport protein|nr:dicarboxylate/amino acid:cation symporter [Verrucomicrobiota bacterium]